VNISASAKKDPALRIFFYTPRRGIPQLCLLPLMLAIGTLPLNGVRPSQSPLLTPLRTTFVPFDSGVGAPNLAPIQVHVPLGPAKHIALSPSRSFQFAAPNCRLVSAVEADRYSRSTFVASVPGRSPPFAS
jgi:hypothetical protein